MHPQLAQPARLHPRASCLQIISIRIEVFVKFSPTQRGTGGDGDEYESCESGEEAHDVGVELLAVL
jgi:hypothetical protein